MVTTKLKIPTMTCPRCQIKEMTISSTNYQSADDNQSHDFYDYDRITNNTLR